MFIAWRTEAVLLSDMYSSPARSSSTAPHVQNPQTNHTLSELSTTGAFNGTGLATLNPNNGADQLYLIFQHYSGEIRYSHLTDSNVWLNGIATPLVSSNVKNGTLIAATSYNPNGTANDNTTVGRLPSVHLLRKPCADRRNARSSSSISIAPEPCAKSIRTSALAPGSPATSSTSASKPPTAQLLHSLAAGTQLGTALTLAPAVAATAAASGYTLGAPTAWSRNSCGMPRRTPGNLDINFQTVTATPGRAVCLWATRVMCTCRIRLGSWSCGGRITISAHLILRLIPVVLGFKVTTTSPDTP